MKVSGSPRWLCHGGMASLKDVAARPVSGSSRSNVPVFWGMVAYTMMAFSVCCVTASARGEDENTVALAGFVPSGRMSPPPVLVRARDRQRESKSC